MGAFRFEHFLKRAHSKKSTFQKDTFQKEHIPKRAHSKKSTFQNIKHNSFRPVALHGMLNFNFQWPVALHGMLNFNFQFKMLSRLHCIVSRAHPSLIFCYTLTFFPWKTFSFFLNNQLVLLQLSFPLPFFSSFLDKYRTNPSCFCFLVSTGGKLPGFTLFSVLRQKWMIGCALCTVTWVFARILFFNLQNSNELFLLRLKNFVQPFLLPLPLVFWPCLCKKCYHTLST